METVETEGLLNYCVYLITCLVNGKQYAGQTCWGAKRRWSSHKSAAKNGSTLRFYRAINKYGVENFVVTVLREGLTKEEADQEETLTIRTLRLTEPEFGYNLSGGGAGGVASEEMRRKMSENAPWLRKDVSTEEIISLYRGGLSMTQISEKFGMSHRSVGRRIHKTGEPTRSMSEAVLLRTGPRVSDEEINRMYSSGMDSVEIAEKLDVDSTTIRRRLHESGVMRTRSEAQILRRGVLNTEEIVLLYREGMSLSKIAAKFGVSHPAIRYRLVQANEPRRSISEASLLERKSRRAA